MFLLSLLTNKDSCNTQITQCVNDTIFTKRFRVPGFGTGSGTLEPVPWNRFLRQITSHGHYVRARLHTNFNNHFNVTFPAKIYSLTPLVQNQL